MDDFSRQFGAMVTDLSFRVTDFWKKQLDQMVEVDAAEQKRFAEIVFLGNLLREERAARYDLEVVVGESAQHLSATRHSIAGLFESEILDAAFDAGKEAVDEAWAEIETLAKEAEKKAEEAKKEAEAAKEEVIAAKSEAEAAKLKAKILGLQA